MQTLKFFAVPVVIIAIWVALAANILTSLDRFARDTRTPSRTAVPQVTAGR